jgi:protein SCO1
MRLVVVLGLGQDPKKRGRSMKRKFFWLMCFWVILLTNGASGHELPGTGDAGSGTIGVEEKTGKIVPANLAFYDEEGQKVKLGNFLGKPAILVIVYYTCEHVCPQLLGGLSQALPRLAFLPVTDYRVITVSIDAADTPRIARAAKTNYLQAIGPFAGMPDRIFPENGWKFLTGPQQSIRDLTDAVGFSYRKEVDGFTHPVVLVFLSPGGKISGYYYVTKFKYGQGYPISFASFDLNVALTEAASGHTVTGFKKAVLYCFSHEPPGQSKFFNFMAVVGIFTLLAMVSFFVYLQVTTKKNREAKKYDPAQ